MDKLLNSIKPEWILYGVALGVGVLWLRGFNRSVADTAETVTALPFSLFQGAAAGVVGVPRTDTPEAQSRCQAALNAGDDWEASFYCPASTWLGGLFDGK